MPLKWSRFNILADKENEDRCLLYNTFNDSQILCDDKTIVRQFKEKIETHQDLTNEENEFAETLTELGYLIDETCDEKDEFLQWFDGKIRNNFEQLSCLVLTSRTCNLRCPYRFEKDVLDAGLNMSQETADQFIKWNQIRIDRYGSKKLDITFFGGEPLVNIPVLDRIASQMHEFCNSRHVEFEFGIITNGVLLTPALVEKLKAWGLKWVKITLDGDKHDHDKLRVNQAGQGTFDKIWKNLENIKGMIPVYIGGNFNMDNAQSLGSLVDKLDKATFRENLFAVEFKPIQTKSGWSKPAPIRTNFTGPAFEAEQVEVMMKARDYIFEKGLPGNNQVGIGPCELHRKSYFGVDMDGKLYKCSAMVGRQEFASGSIWEGEDWIKVDERMGQGIQPWKDCGDCPFIPVCAGGCKAVGYDRYGDFTVGSCDIVYFRNMVQEMLERNLKEAFAYEDGHHVENAEMLVKNAVNE